MCMLMCLAHVDEAQEAEIDCRKRMRPFWWHRLVYCASRMLAATCGSTAQHVWLVLFSSRVVEVGGFGRAHLSNVSQGNA